MALALIIALQLSSPEAALEAALQAVEPLPSLRASFSATISNGEASRRISFDPYRQTGEKFQVISRAGEDKELDAIVDGWRAERQADVRLFADDLRVSLGGARAVADAGGWAIQFRHQISQNDSAIDAAISSAMTGRLDFQPQTGLLSSITYDLVRPIKLQDGTTLRSYRQTYRFGYSQRWGVSYVTDYALEAKGGRWGFYGTRQIRVLISDVVFGLAGDARQQLASKAISGQGTASSGMP
jgi:hypothetical protein